MNFQLPSLLFPMNTLEPVISVKIMEFRYLKHHKAFGNSINKLTEGNVWSGKTLEELLRSSEGGIFNNAALVWNHTFSRESLHSHVASEPKESILSEIQKAFGSLENIKEQFKQASVGLFGSSWALLVKDFQGTLKSNMDQMPEIP